MSLALRLGTPFARIPLWVAQHPAVSDRGYRLFGLLAAEYADHRDGTCYPSRTRLANDLRCSRPAVDRAIRSLHEAGALVVERRRDAAGDWTSNRYTLRFEPPASDPGSHTSVTTHAEGGSYVGVTTGSHTGVTVNQIQIEPEEERALRAPCLPWDWPEPRLPFETPLPPPGRRLAVRTRAAPRPAAGRLPLLGAVWLPRRAEGVSAGVQCPHTPRCATIHACIDRAITDGRRARAEALR